MRLVYDILEDPNVDDPEELAVLQKMIDDGSVWGLQGYIGSMIADLIAAGYLRYSPKRTYDYYGHPIMTRAEAMEREILKKGNEGETIAIKKQLIIPEKAVVAEKEKQPEEQANAAEAIINDIEKEKVNKQKRLRA